MCIRDRGTVFQHAQRRQITGGGKNFFQQLLRRGAARHLPQGGKVGVEILHLLDKGVVGRVLQRQQQCAVQADAGGLFVRLGLYPVSYTHLDVYKRQVLDYGKYRFEQQKKEKEAKKNQKVVEVKETRLSLNIDTNDFNTKLNQTAKFLAAGHKVKVSIRFRGREMAHSALGADVLKRFAEALPQASTDKPPVLEGRTMSILLIPKPNKD